MSTDQLDALRQWAAAERDNDADELANARAARDAAIAAVNDPTLAIPGAIYVVVCANDKPHPRYGRDEHGAIIHETYVKDTTLAIAHQRAAQFERWCACRIARLVFEDQPGFAEPQSGQKRTSRCPHGVSELNHCTRCD